MNKHSLWKLLTGVAITALLAATLLIGVLPKIQAIQDSNSVTSVTARQTARQLRQLAKLNVLAKSQASIEARLAQMVGGMPQENATSSLLVQLQRAANIKGASIDTLTIGEPKPYALAANLATAGLTPKMATLGSGKLFTQVVSIGASGSFGALKDLLSAIKSMKRTTLIYSVSLSRTPQAATKVEASLNVIFEIFSLR